MSLKAGMAWADPTGQPSPTIEESIEQAARHYKASRGRWPNFVRVSLADASRLGNRLNGLLVIGDRCAGRGYRLLMGWSEEAVKHVD